MTSFLVAQFSRVRPHGRALSRSLLIAILALLSLPASAEVVRRDHINVELVAAQTAAVPGTPLTLALRMERHNQTGAMLADWLENHVAVERVLYPGLESHPNHAVACRQMEAFGGMITIFLKGGLDAAKTMLERVRVFTLAESLGGVESLIEHPGIMTHASIPPERRAELGVDDALVRLSVGIEDPADLQAQ